MPDPLASVYVAASFTRLPGGEWGIRITGPDAANMTGREIDVAKRGGSTCRQRLGEIVRTDGRSAVYRKSPEHDCGKRWEPNMVGNTEGSA